MEAKTVEDRFSGLCKTKRCEKIPMISGICVLLVKKLH